MTILLRICFFIFSVFAVAGCTGSKLADVINHTSSMEIRFTDSLGNVTGVHKTNFSGEINMLNKYFTGEEARQYKCGFDGKILLKGKDTTEVDFSLNNKCQYISFMIDNAEYTEDVSLEGIGYLKKLRFKVTDIPAKETKKDSLNTAK